MRETSAAVVLIDELVGTANTIFNGGTITVGSGEMVMFAGKGNTAAHVNFENRFTPELESKALWRGAEHAEPVSVGVHMMLEKVVGK